MDSREVGDLLEGCLRAAESAALESTQPTEAQRLNYCSCRDSLCVEVASLLQEAMEMKWPFVPEKWQYKQSVSSDDKTNLSDLISKHLLRLLALLKASIVAQETSTALAVVFLVDRFLYWTDESMRLLKITKLLHRFSRDTPVAPQLVIRQARVYLNSGKLQKAEYILSGLINTSGATGCWVYHSESDKALVQAVSVQVRGMILQKLGLWLEAAELIWASLVGYYSLPQPDKKGIGTSLNILANILLSMNDEDFNIFRTNPNIELHSLLGNVNHRLLSAAQAAKMAVIYSQYTPLYVLTNVATQGTCLLSYSFSMQCPESQRRSFLLNAIEAFAIGLLTKTEGELVTSKQELHTFIKAAYSITMAHKWLGTPHKIVVQATHVCQKALVIFYDYCQADTKARNKLCAEIMHLVAQVKLLLRVEPFLNSDKGSFIPDNYRNINDAPVTFTLEGFSNLMQRFQKYHASLCKTNNSNCNRNKDQIDGPRFCITALGTTVGTLSTEPSAASCKDSKDTAKGSNSSPMSPPQQPDVCSTLESTDDLGSSWQNFSLSSSGSPRPSNSSYPGGIANNLKADAWNQKCLTTEVEDGTSNDILETTDQNKKQNTLDCQSSVSSEKAAGFAKPSTSSSVGSSNTGKFEVIQAEIETLDTEDLAADASGTQSVANGAQQSLSQLTLRTSSSSLGDSFNSQSSWEKISAGLMSPTNRKLQPTNLLKAGSGQSSSESDGSFFLLETADPETSDSTSDTTHKPPSKPHPRGSPTVHLGMDTEIDSVFVKSVVEESPTSPQPKLSQCASTETSSESSFELLDENPKIQKSSQAPTDNETKTKNLSCFSCLKNNNLDGAVPKRQYSLSHLDYQALLAGVCSECLLKRLQSNTTQFKLKEHGTAHSALHLKFSKATGLWTARETCVYIGEPMGMEGKQRTAIWVQFLHQEERLSSYVGKDYLKPKQIQFHLKDVERQMTAQYYVTEFNKSLYDKEVMAQIFFIPSEALLILDRNEIVGCVTVEPYMLGEFVKMTNNTGKKDQRFQATDYGLAFGHFTYLLSDCQEVVVDLQGWVTANGKGLTYLTDPQIHSIRTPRGPSNFGARGLRYFLEEQHGPECNNICQLLQLPMVDRKPHSSTESLGTDRY